MRPFSGADSSSSCLRRCRTRRSRHLVGAHPVQLGSSSCRSVACSTSSRYSSRAVAPSCASTARPARAELDDARRVRQVVLALEQPKGPVPRRGCSGGRHPSAPARARRHRRSNVLELLIRQPQDAEPPSCEPDWTDPASASKHLLDHPPVAISKTCSGTLSLEAPRFPAGKAGSPLRPALACMELGARSRATARPRRRDTRACLRRDRRCRRSPAESRLSSRGRAPAAAVAAYATVANPTAVRPARPRSTFVVHRTSWQQSSPVIRTSRNPRRRLRGEARRGERVHVDEALEGRVGRSVALDRRGARADRTTHRARAPPPRAWESPDGRR